MGTMICRPFITLKNGRRLFAHEVGKTAFCFEVEEVKPAKSRAPLQGELDLDSIEPDDDSPLH
ncbi:hypothetical protein TUM18999_61240 [Pseudomonas tohonis]|uniref:Uncharacterized protein n=1 Tax=Pseudomonas tohonis TaxID=2725477 RepID=A0A6J4EDB7_9PSED|nr:hypothetical protein [Pseudomonas tohonis]BCG27933.1 hypothetical protein TUM18999_61240 [Pseudomonas tohonis]GJN52545.1 hypothetical protein TUM20286_22970 [Pseudomonas tohonis]